MAIASPKKKQELERQFKINPEVNAKLDAFMQGEPGLVQLVKELPREQLERKFLLRKMLDQDQSQGYSAKVKSWLGKPEQADLVKKHQGHPQPQHETREAGAGALDAGTRTTTATKALSSTEAECSRVGHEVMAGALALRQIWA